MRKIYSKDIFLKEKDVFFMKKSIENDETLKKGTRYTII